MNREEVIKTAKENFEKKPLDFEMRPELDIYTCGMIDGYKMAEKKLSSELSDQCDELYIDYEKRLKQLREENEISNKHILELQADKGELTDKLNESKKQIKILTDSLTEVCNINKELEAQIEKMKNALNKIIKTVQNDNISGYGERLVKIYDISCEVLQEIKEK